MAKRTIKKKNRVKWCRSPKDEAVLDSLDISYEIVSLPMSQVNWDALAKNCGRVTRPKNESDVEDYRQMMEAGDEFPMCIYGGWDDGFVPASGAHRSWSAKGLEEDEIKCYLADISTEGEYEVIALLTNRNNGTKMERQEALEKAVELGCRPGAPPLKEIANLLSVNVNTLRARVKTWKMRETINDQLGIESLDDISDNVVNVLAKYQHEVPILTAFCALANTQKLTGDECREYSKRVDRCKTEKSKLLMLERLSNEHDKLSKVQGRRPSIVTSRAAKLRSGLSMLMISLGDRPSLTNMNIDKEDPAYGDFRKDFQDVFDKIKRLFGLQNS